MRTSMRKPTAAEQKELSAARKSAENAAKARSEPLSRMLSANPDRDFDDAIKRRNRVSPAVREYDSMENSALRKGGMAKAKTKRKSK